MAETVSWCDYFLTLNFINKFYRVPTFYIFNNPNEYGKYFENFLSLFKYIKGNYVLYYNLDLQIEICKKKYIAFKTSILQYFSVSNDNKHDSKSHNQDDIFHCLN